MAGETDFLVWNPSAANQENDSTYSGDSQRISGAATPSEFAAPLANKLFYQTSLMVASLAQMLAAKGFSPVDGTTPLTAASAPSSGTPEANLAAVLANILTVADSATIIGLVFAGAAFGSNSNGYYLKLPPSLGTYIIQWGISPSGTSVTFPINLTASTVPTVLLTGINVSIYSLSGTPTHTGFNMSVSSEFSVSWFAIGH